MNMLCLDFSLSSQDVTTGKPDPEIYVQAMQRLGFRPEQCLVVEDNENGKQAARASGAWLMEVSEVEEVNYPNIMRTILRIEGHSV
jgi:beta-phosphoglucomutase